MRTALLAVALVWLLGCVWSYQEQSAFAASKGFAFPHLLPLVIDGFAVSMAGVSWAASLDARPALPARLATLVAVGASSASNGVWAWLRTHHDAVTVALAIAVPVAANLAFEVLLGELRRQVQRSRGLPPPVAIPYPRVIRIVLAPGTTFRTWRALVLTLTADHLISPDPLVASRTSADPGTGSAEPAAARRQPRPSQVPPSPQPSARAHPLMRVPEPAAGSASAVASPPPALDEAAGVKPLVARPREMSTGSTARTGARSGRRDKRVLQLARHLTTLAEPDEITGEQVGQLLGVQIAPRTGRRLLGQARELRGTSDGHPEQRLAGVSSR
jgi:hypothetical protein